MNGALATSTSTIAGGAAGFAVVLAGAGAVGEAGLFAAVAAIALLELFAFVPWPKLVVCGLVAGYAFLASFMVPIGPAEVGHSSHVHAHAVVR